MEDFGYQSNNLLDLIILNNIISKNETFIVDLSNSALYLHSTSARTNPIQSWNRRLQKSDLDEHPGLWSTHQVDQHVRHPQFSGTSFLSWNRWIPEYSVQFTSSATRKWYQSHRHPSQTHEQHVPNL